MTETKGRYHVNSKPGVIRPTCFLEYDQGYTQPNSGEIREMINRLSMSGSEVSRLVGVSSGRTVRKWQAEDGSANSAAIPYAAWRLMVLKLAGCMPHQAELNSNPALLNI